MWPWKQIEKCEPSPERLPRIANPIRDAPAGERSEASLGARRRTPSFDTVVTAKQQKHSSSKSPV